MRKRDIIIATIIVAIVIALFGYLINSISSNAYDTCVKSGRDPKICAELNK